MAVQYTTFTTSEGDELANVNVQLLTRREAHDLHLELRQQVYHQTELMSEEEVDFYNKKIKEICDFLGED